MRIGELSRRTGVPVPTIKYYVREGLLPAGLLTSPNQATYGEAHERRLRLIRALLDVGGLKVAAIGEVLAAVDDPDKSVHKVLGVATDLLVPRYAEGKPDAVPDAAPDDAPDAAPDAVMEAARERVGELIERRGWRIGDDYPGRKALAVTLATLEGVGHGEFAEVLDAYADAAESLALADLDYVATRKGRDGLVEGAVIGTVLGNALISALRHLTHVDRSARLYESGELYRDESAAGPGPEGRDPGAASGAGVGPGGVGSESAPG
ncbi:MerR family transcriptional regulator [Streptomyces katsurahamanus]|uniref:MerR family transcriptional regulator n=1 Tax=Streptomyces katsurahamanus TaxID=2577098 RepID=A0ABW9NW13_9ACTN|nr:MerR family transcriptional regulator [Streptomyces katsurahamanus]MQS37059.1 MerR family transcriptional regulator [Streptomyces katsurahamanus]